MWYFNSIEIKTKSCENRWLLNLFIIVFITGVFINGLYAQSLPIQKNVLVLIADDHGVDQVGCYGNSVIKTPGMDKLAASGVRFNNAFAASASCSASRGTILTGLYPHQNGQYGHTHNWHHFSLLESVETLPELLKANGYRTGIIGKKHVAPDSKLPFDFEVKDGSMKSNRDVMSMAKKAGEFFQSEKEKPFFMYIGYGDPHRHFTKWINKEVEDFSGFANTVDYEGVVPVKYSPADVPVPGYLPDEPEVRAELADMYESVSRMDQGIGAVIDELKKSGRYENTLIIYISDHGIPFPGAKTNLYDSALRIPFLVYAPGIENPGGVNNALVSLADLTPTILDWTGSSLPAYNLPGKSFMPVLNEENPEGWDQVNQSHTFHEITMFYPMRGVRTNKFHYILNIFPELEFPFATDLYTSKTWEGIITRNDNNMGKRKVDTYLKRPAEELYDIQADPDETNNLAGSAEFKVVLGEMRKKMKDFRTETDDRWLINDNYLDNKTLY